MHHYRVGVNVVLIKKENEVAEVGGLILGFDFCSCCSDALFPFFLCSSLSVPQLQNVKKKLQDKTFKPNFTPRKVRKSRQI